MNWRDKDDLKMGPPSAAGDLVAERNRLREEVQTLVDALTQITEGLSDEDSRPLIRGHEVKQARAVLAKVKVKKKPK